MRGARGSFLLLCCAVLALAPASRVGADRTPAEYRPEEFAPWMWKLRRAETILFGTLPFSLFVVTFGYDSIRYFRHAGETGALRYAPWPFRGPDAAPYTRAETTGMAIGVLVCSAALALADYLVGELGERRAVSR